MKEDFLNTVTSKIKNRKIVDFDRLRTELDKVNIFRKIRLAYALKYRTIDTDSILYRIRNGKSWATDFNFIDKVMAKDTLDIVYASIVSNSELKESEVRYLNLLNSILDILVEFNSNLIITYINSQVYGLLGYSSEEIIGKRFTDLVHPNDKSRVKKIIDNTTKKNEPISIELNVQHKKGYYIQFSGKGQLIEDNNHVKIVLLLRDITEIKENQRKLMESDKKYREIIENIEIILESLKEESNLPNELIEEIAKAKELIKEKD